jgi:Ni/Fe-hydrogenase subunit HybB-like protein
MLEKVLVGKRSYWAWVGGLAVLVALGATAYRHQLVHGLGVTGLSRDVSWGLYIAQFTFLVGVAASAVTVVLPYALHDFKQFARITILGEMLAISAVVTCLLFVVVDMGQPSRVLNVLLYPSPHSVMFWDLTVLSGYLLLNVVISRTTLDAERKAIGPPAWLRPVVILSIPWAIAIHTVTAFLYSGLAARPFWMTALLAPRFLASAFASGPALLILVCLLLRRLARFDAGAEAVQKLAVLVTYALATNLFFLAVELFTALYSGIPEHIHHFEYLFLGLGSQRGLVPWMWTAEILAVLALILLLSPRWRARQATLVLACASVFASVWIEKGLGLVVTGFVPSPLGRAASYLPTGLEVLIAAGVYGIGLLVLTGLFKIVLAVRSDQVV